MWAIMEKLRSRSWGIKAPHGIGRTLTRWRSPLMVPSGVAPAGANSSRPQVTRLHRLGHKAQGLDRRPNALRDQARPNRRAPRRDQSTTPKRRQDVRLERTARRRYG